MAFPKRIDKNQPEITKAFRDMDVLVQVISNLGKGVPDLIVSIDGYLVFVEIKDGSKPPSARKLTADEQKWHNIWHKNVVIINSIAEVKEFVEKVRSMMVSKCCESGLIVVHVPDGGDHYQCEKCGGHTTGKFMLDLSFNGWVDHAKVLSTVKE